MAGRTIGYAETIAIEAFLGYLNKRYSKLINPKDPYLIAAVGAWFFQESGGIKNVIGNNPFNIRPGITSFMASGVRTSRNGNGKFLIFPTLAAGFQAAAYLLIHGSKAYGYLLAVNALKRGGNQAAVDFLAALSQSSWDSAHYGATDWLAAYNPSKNHLLRVYQSITGVQLSDPNPPKPKKKPIPVPDHTGMNYNVIVKNYLDPYRAADLYKRRRHRVSSRT